MQKQLSMRAWRSRVRERGSRKDHDLAMGDPRVAAEHRLAIDRSRARGDGGCEFCDGRRTFTARLRGH